MSVALFGETEAAERIAASLAGYEPLQVEAAGEFANVWFPSKTRYREAGINPGAVGMEATVQMRSADAFAAKIVQALQAREAILVEEGYGLSKYAVQI